MDEDKSRNVLMRLQAILEQARGKMPEGPNEYYPSESGKVEVHFDYGTLSCIRTPEGQYLFTAEHAQPQESIFNRLLNEAFVVEELRPKRDDEKRGDDFSMADYLIQCSGPVLALTLKAVNS